MFISVYKCFSSLLKCLRSVNKCLKVENVYVGASVVPTGTCYFSVSVPVFLFFLFFFFFKREGGYGTLVDPIVLLA